MFIPINTSVNNGRIRMGSLGIILICLVMHLLLAPQMSKWESQYQREFEQIITEAQAEMTTETDAVDLVRGIQKELGLKKQEMLKNSPLKMFGFTPAEFNPVHLFTSLFVHGGWMHLIFNMLFFYLCAVAMEHHWGTPRFLLAYLGSGIFATGFYSLVTWIYNPAALGIPLVGASGAIAGAMGAFLIVHAKSKVSILYMGFSIIPKTFQIPSWLYLSLWFLGELLFTLFFSGSNNDVAYSAHVGGFLAGVFFAKTLQSEESASIILNPAIKSSPLISIQEPAAPQQNLSPIEKAWLSYDQNDIEGAHKQFLALFDKWFSDPDHHLDDITFHLEKIFRKGRKIKFPPAQLLQWGIRLRSYDIGLLALGCFEMGFQENAAHNIKQRCHLRAGETGLEIGRNQERSIWHLQQLLNPNSPVYSIEFAAEANRVLARFGVEL
jgi:membrane associated rhomboid family serine protease